MNLKKKWPWLAAIACVVAAVAVLRHVLAQPEPVYNGKPLSAWFKRAAKRDQKAIGIFTQAGPAAVPFLARELQRGDSRWERIYSGTYPKFPAWLQKRLGGPLEPRHATAAFLLSDLGPAAEPAYGDMLKVYDRAYQEQEGLPLTDYVDWQQEFAHPRTLMPAAYGSEGWFVRGSLLDAFCNLPGAHKEVVPLVLSALRDRLQFNPYFAVLNNTNLSASTRLAEPTLLIAITDSVPNIRMCAANLLGMLAPDHPECVGPLQKATEDADLNVRTNALLALTKASMPFEKMLLMTSGAVEDPDPRVRGQAMQTLVKASGGIREFGQKLVTALDSPDPAIRATAASQLGRFGPRSKEAIPKLTQLTLGSNEPDPHVREQAAAALAKIEGKR